MLPVFMQHYGYKADEALQEYGKRFFALCAQMFKIQANNNLQNIAIINGAVNGGSGADSLISRLKQQAGGNDKLIQEAKTLREVKERG